MKPLDILIVSDETEFADKVEQKLQQICHSQAIETNIHRELNGSSDLDLTILVDDNGHVFKTIQDIADISKRVYIFTKRAKIDLTLIKKLFNCKVEGIAGKSPQNIHLLTDAVKAAFQTATTVNRIQQKVQKLSELTAT